MSPTEQASPPIGTLKGVQVLRFVAAFLVMYTHATFYVASRVDSSFGMWLHGAQGVPIFFVVSGFVMALTSRSLAGQPDGHKIFMLQRLIRIVPLYWAVNVLKIVSLLVVPAALFARPDVLNIVLSMLFIPSRNSEGLIETFYGVGWTLNFEMFFYVVFAVALWLKQRALVFAGPVLLAAAGLSLLRSEHWPAFTYLLNPIVINFLWGLVLAELMMAGYRLPVWAAAALTAAACVVIFAWPGANLLGAQYGALVAGVVFMESAIGAWIPRGLVAGGDASYALYLLHPLVGVVIAIVLAKLGVTSAWLALATIIGGSLAVAALVFYGFERPITRWLRRRLLTGTPVSGPKAQPSS